MFCYRSWATRYHQLALSVGYESIESAFDILSHTEESQVSVSSVSKADAIPDAQRHRCCNECYKDSWSFADTSSGRKLLLANPIVRGF